MTFTVIPSLDILGGRVVRLTRGDFASAHAYGDAEEVRDRLQLPAGCTLHVVDLDGSRDGSPRAVETIGRLSRRDVRIQAAGGIRTTADARGLLDAGAERVVTGTLAAEEHGAFRELVRAIGAERIVAAIDVLDGRVRVSGWQREASRDLEAVLHEVERSGVEEILVTDISRDGTLGGPSFGLYRRLARKTKLKIIASGGVATLGDVVSLARIPNVSGCVIGKALLDGRFSVREAKERAAGRDAIPVRVIPCLDVRGGRVVKGVNFAAIRDAGDPEECAARYEADGADELVVLDISATDQGRATALETVQRVAGALFIPLTAGGGVRTIEDFRALLRAGADRVAINTAAVQKPDLIREARAEFGAQAVVLSCDAKKSGEGYEVMVRGGKEPAGIDAVQWCAAAAEMGCGEILLTSVDRDGTHGGFDLGLLRAVSAAVRVSIIASGGAGSCEHFREAVEHGAQAVLAASQFHDGHMRISDVKRYLDGEGIPVR